MRNSTSEDSLRFASDGEGDEDFQPVRYEQIRDATFRKSFATALRKQVADDRTFKILAKDQSVIDQHVDSFIQTFCNEKPLEATEDGDRTLNWPTYEVGKWSMTMSVVEYLSNCTKVDGKGTSNFFYVDLRCTHSEGNDCLDGSVQVTWAAPAPTDTSQTTEAENPQAESEDEDGFVVVGQ